MTQYLALLAILTAAAALLGTLLLACSRLPEQCQGIEDCDNDGEWYRQNTYYADDSKNVVCMCKDCQKINDEHWQTLHCETRPYI